MSKFVFFVSNRIFQYPTGNPVIDTTFPIINFIHWARPRFFGMDYWHSKHIWEVHASEWMVAHFLNLIEDRTGGRFEFKNLICEESADLRFAISRGIRGIAACLTAAISE